MTIAELIVPCADQCGESALWDWRSRTLYWLDLYRPTLHWLSTSRQHHVYPITGTDLLACLLLRPAAGLPCLISRDSIGSMEISGTVARFHAEKQLVDRDAREAFSDGKTHPAGVAWLGTSDTKEQEAIGQLAVFRSDAPTVFVDDKIIVSNGPAFSPDGGFAYFSDTMARKILRYRVGEDGVPTAERKVFAEFGEADGNPDGLTVDADGRIWVAMWDGGSVRCLDTEGRELTRITVPARRVTSVAFGDDDLSTLYITTAAVGLDDAAIARGAGGLFAVRPGAIGRQEPVIRF